MQQNVEKPATLIGACNVQKQIQMSGNHHNIHTLKNNKKYQGSVKSPKK